MGYEIAGGIGVKMARPEREVVVLVGDGSYLMLNSEIATSVMLGTKLVVVVLDNRGYGCIHRLQQACGGEPLQQPVRRLRAGAERSAGASTSRAHAKSLGALARARATRSASSKRRSAARAPPTARTSSSSTPIRGGRRTAGGWWWEVGVPEVSESPNVRAARAVYDEGKRAQRP